ncbi:sodium:solute symporter family protein [Echinicola jeungdonensis]|uniref:Sodium:solute symporter n=1 Tax=Echinicola jeungdonensis TaxID=709343 RepID=A0ABV5J2E8_9BACT|nr:sodium:solute symporter family protein [Echinicola jeungdonensis]MDN3667959.1 sodium:solute symporter family protein [Echinicola jeungdonensis]
METIDLIIFVVYMILMLGVGFYFMRSNKGQDDYFVGGRSMGSWHIGLSVVATDVGGGFSIGLGGLGFAMGLSGSWMLFTGLLGAWLAGVFLIPKVKQNPAFAKFYTFPQIFKYLFNRNVAIVAAIISFVGYLGFTSSQLLAGAKLAAGTFRGLDINLALLIMGVIAVVYTVLGGLKAVIYTDTVQWIILLMGFIFIGLPVSYFYVGGWKEISETLPDKYFSLANLTWQDLANWGITILPIWFVGMTLYQRIFASRDVKSAQKAWYIAGVFEWPIMAFMGVSLGVLARVAFEQDMIAVAKENLDPEMGLPILLRTVLPPGIMGLMMSAYFSAVLSTADSCLMAASGNITTDLCGRWLNKKKDWVSMRIGQLFTLLIGTGALIIAIQMTNVLELMLYSYAFMVSGLLVPILAGLFWDIRNPMAAMASMIVGGGVTAGLSIWGVTLPLKLDPNFFGVFASLLVFVLIYKVMKLTKSN